MSALRRTREAPAAQRVDPGLVVLRGGRERGLPGPAALVRSRTSYERRQVLPGGPLRVLMVEDSAADGRLVIELLREAGMNCMVERVSRIGEAQEYLERHKVDCVLLDLGLLDSDGLDGLRLIVAADADVPIVVLTRRDDDLLPSEALRHGAQDYLAKRDLEPQLLARSIRYAIERTASQLQLVHLARHDGLTGLANRALFLERLQACLERPAGVGVMFVDLDNLKLVNDALGHDAGDRLLTSVAHRLVDVVRPSDTVARFGGDEFAVLCPGLLDRRRGEELAVRIMAEVCAPLLLGTRVYVPAISMGVVQQPFVPSVTAERVLADADLALYVAKRNGKARFEMFDDSLRTSSGSRLTLLSELRTAMVEEQFDVHYQPEVSLATGELVAVEALLRWRHPSRGLLPAGSFIGGVEESGLVAELGGWVLQQACEALAGWPGAGAPRMAVNVSPRQFSMSGFADEVVEVMAVYGIRPDQLELEVTEAALLVDDSVAQVLRDLHGLGLRLAIDDFGTGFSSLNHLKLFPASTVKIDQSFVAGLGRDATDEAIVAAVLGVAHSLGLSTVGEGIETVAQRDRLTELGCELGQGFLLGRSMSRDEMYSRFARG